MTILRKYLLLILTLVAFQQISSAQKVLLQENPNTGRRTRYRVSDEVKLKVRNSRESYIGVITQITDSAVTVNGRITLGLREIGYLRPLYKHYFLNVMESAFIDAGVLYPAIDIANRALNKQFPIPVSTAYISGELLGTAFITRYIIERRYTLAGHKKLRVIDVSIEPVKE